MVGEKDRRGLAPLIPELDVAQERVVPAAARRFVKEADLIALNAAALGNGSPLHSGVERDAVSIGEVEPSGIVVAAIEDQVRFRSEPHHAGHGDLVRTVFDDDGIAGQQFPVIEQWVLLDRAPEAPVFGLVVDRSADLDQGGVERDQLDSKLEAIRPWGRSVAAQRLEKHALVQLPAKPMFVGASHGGRLGRVGQAQVGPPAGAGGQPTATLAHRFRTRQLTEQHGDELASTGEAAGMEFSLLIAHCNLNLGMREQLRHFTENAGYSKLRRRRYSSSLCPSIRTPGGTLTPPLKRYFGQE